MTLNLLSRLRKIIEFPPIDEEELLRLPPPQGKRKVVVTCMLFRDVTVPLNNFKQFGRKVVGDIDVQLLSSIVENQLESFI